MLLEPRIIYVQKLGLDLHFLKTILAIKHNDHASS